MTWKPEGHCFTSQLCGTTCRCLCMICTPHPIPPDPRDQKIMMLGTNLERMGSLATFYQRQSIAWKRFAKKMRKTVFRYRELFGRRRELSDALDALNRWELELETCGEAGCGTVATCEVREKLSELREALRKSDGRIPLR